MSHSDPLTNHIISQTLSSLQFLQSQNILYASPELDFVRTQLSSRQTQPHSNHNAAPPTYGSNGLDNAFHNLNVSSNPPPAPPVLPARGPEPMYGEKPRDRAVALWDYTASSGEDLSFRSDEVVVIDEEVNPQWYRGHIESDPNRRGLFPNNYIRRLQPGERSNTYPTDYKPPLPPIQPYNHQVQPYNPPPPPQAYYQPPPPPQQQYGYQQPPQPVQSQGTGDSGKKNKFKLPSSGLGNTLAHSAVGGLGFGAGSAAASNLVNSILH